MSRGEPFKGDQDDEALVAAAVAGDSKAVDRLVRGLERWVYNFALRMLWEPRDAEDATQEILVRIVTRLSGFRGESTLRTWAWRIALNHLLRTKKSKAEEVVHGFECYGAYLDAAPDLDPLGLARSGPEEALLFEEAKQACVLGMLLCLERDQRLVFVLAEIFGASDAQGAELLEVSRDGFRQSLHRARAALHEFLRGKCGLIDPENPCRCARKTRAFIRDGLVDPQSLRFVGAHLDRVRSVSRDRAKLLENAARAPAELFGEGHLLEPPDFTARLRLLLEHPGLRAALELE